MTNLRWILGAGIILLCVYAGAYALNRSAAGMPSCRDCTVFLISLDQVRAKSLPCFAYTQDTAPNLCRLARRSGIFTNAFATASRTMDSHFSMITGLYPRAHAMNLPYASVLPDTIPTLAELLTKEGYRTVFMGPKGDPHLPLTKGLERGFAQVVEADSPSLWIDAMESLATGSGGLDRKALYVLHTYKAHEPYTPEEDTFRRFYSGPHTIPISYDALCEYTYRKLRQLHPDREYEENKTGSYCGNIETYIARYSRTFDEYDDTYTIFNTRYWELFDGLSFEDKQEYVHALYAASIYELDRELQEFFDYLDGRGLLAKSIIIIVGDQGDEFGEHGGWSHAWSLYNEVLHVPFIVSVPGMKPQVSGKLASLVDIVPTIFGLLGKDGPATVSGIDLFSPKRHNVIAAEHVSDGAFALRTDAYTLIRRSGPDWESTELYDIRSDPGETVDIYEKNKAQAASILKAYQSNNTRMPAFSSTPLPLPSWLDEQDRQDLIESGYF